MKVLSTAPSRISLFGGGTDIDSYALQYGGLVINLAINLRQQITMYSDEDIYEVPGANVFPYKARPEFYYKILDEYGLNDMHFTKLICKYDAIIESGLGSSASAAVCLLGAINKRKKLGLSIDEIAHKAWELEVGKIGLFGGKQDQYIATFGGVNVMEFGKTVKVTPLSRSFIAPILPYMMLFYTGQNRRSATIQEKLKDLTEEQIASLHAIKKTAYEAVELITKGDVEKVGMLMTQGWELKKQTNSKATTDRLEQIYHSGLKAGAFGGKVLGAGSGGFCLFLVPLEKQKRFIQRMKEMGVSHWDFSVDYNGLEVRDITNK